MWRGNNMHIIPVTKFGQQSKKSTANLGQKEKKNFQTATPFEPHCVILIYDSRPKTPSSDSIHFYDARQLFLSRFPGPTFKSPDCVGTDPDITSRLQTNSQEPNLFSTQRINVAGR